jgi:hypothetical protein
MFLKLSFYILFVLFLLSGCAKDDEVSKDIPQASQEELAHEVSTISGIISDGPIANAKVYIDENFNASYDIGEPIVVTDENGKFELSFLNKSFIDKYILVAESMEDSVDELDNPGVSLDFLMYAVVDETMEQNLNPSSFKSFLGNYPQFIKNSDDSINIDRNSSGHLLDSISESNLSMFTNYINNQKDEYTRLLQNIAGNLKTYNDYYKFQNDLTSELNISGDFSLSFSDDNISSLNNSQLYKDQTVSKIGDLVIAKQLNPIEVEENVPVNSINDIDVNESISATEVKVNNGNLYYDGNSSNAMVILKRPIMTPVGTDEIKVVLGNKQDLNQSITIFVTPYNTILEVPSYDQIVQMGHKVVVGADITVKGSSKNKLDMKDINVSAVIFDGHADLNASSLSYLYFDGNNWIDANSSVTDEFVGLNSGFKLTPYVLVQKDALSLDINITVDGLRAIENPIIIAKGREDLTQSSENNLGKKILFSTSSSDQSIIVGAINKKGTNKISFKVPEGFSINDLIIIDKNLNRINKSNSAVLKAELIDNYTSIEDDLSLISNNAISSEVSDSIENFIETSFVFNNFSFPNITSLEENATLAKEIIVTNIDNFLLETNSKEFYDNNITTLSWANSTQSNKFQISNKKITYQKDMLDYYTDSVIETEVITMDFSNRYKVLINKTHNFSPDHKYNQFADTQNSTVTYSYSKEGSEESNLEYIRVSATESLVNFEKTRNFKTKYTYFDAQNDYNTTDNRKIKGVSSVTFDVDGFVDSIIGSKINIYKNIFSDGAKSNDNKFNGILEQNATHFHVDSDFEVSTTNFEQISGHMVSRNGTYTKSGDIDKYENNNILNQDLTVYSTLSTYLSNVTKFNSEWLDGKVFYSVYKDINDGIYKIDKVTFSADSFDVESLINSSLSISNTYSITNDGYISYITSIGSNYIIPNYSSSTNDNLKVLWNTTSSTSSQYRNFFLDEAKAKAFFYESIIAQYSPISGTYTSDNCDGGDIEITNNSWLATAYSGSLEMNDNIMTLFTSDGIKAGEATLVVDSDSLEITGTYSTSEEEQTCTGTFSLTN